MRLDVSEGRTEKNTTAVTFRGDRKGSSKTRRISPALKEWMDKVLIPAMVQRYLAETDSNRHNELKERVQ